MGEKFTNIFNPKLNIVLCFAAIIALNVTKSVLILSVAAFVLLTALITVSFAGKSIKFKNICSIILAALIFGMIQTLTVGRNVYFEFNIAGIVFSIYQEGINKGIITFLRILCSFYIILILLKTIKIKDFVSALEWFRLPKEFIEVITLTVKFIHIFKDEIITIRKAQKARLGYSGVLKSIVSIGNAGGVVLCRAFIRSSTLARAMKSRGYEG